MINRYCKFQMLCFILFISATSTLAFFNFPIRANGDKKPEAQDKRWLHKGRSVTEGLQENGISFFRLSGSASDSSKCGMKKGYNYYSLTDFSDKFGTLAVNPAKELTVEIKCRIIDGYDISRNHGQGITIYYGALDDGETGSYYHAVSFVESDGTKSIELSGMKAVELDWSKWHTYIIKIHPSSPDHASFIVKDAEGNVLLDIKNLKTGNPARYPYADVSFGDCASMEFETVWDVASVKIDQTGESVILKNIPEIKRIGPKAPKELKIDGGVQFFIDDYLIDKLNGLKRNVTEAVKYKGNPIIVPDKPWERNRVSLFGSVLKENGIFKMWYYAGSVEQSREPGSGIDKRDNSFLCYATSKDGIHWQKPDLGIIEFEGSKNNNIVLRHHGSHLDSVCILKASWETDPNKKYKLTAYSGTWPYKGGYKKLGYKYPPGHFLYYSDDGLHWRLAQEDPILYLGEGKKYKWQIYGLDASVFCVDEARKKYIGFIKRDYMGKRVRYYTESKDAVHWAQPVLCLHSDDKDPKPETQMYYNSGFAYESMWLGLNMLYYPGTTEAMIPELVYSRDGEKWFRSPVREQHVIPLGPKGSWDAAMISIPSTGPVIVGKEMFYYYGGYGVRHDLKDAAKVKQWGAIGLAKVKLNRFVGLYSDGAGELVTIPLICKGEKLYVNCKVTGSLRVEILDEKGQVLSGFSTKYCKPIKGDHIKAEILWKSGKSLEELKGRPFKLRFLVDSGSIYTFQIE